MWNDGTLTIRRRWDNLNITAKLVFFLPAVLVIYLILPPLILLVVSTFKSTGDTLPLEPSPWTLDNYMLVFSDPDTFILFQNSL
ncbi:MAG: hypothetical protein OEO83_09650, partial [Alphaproteobacteria bacterium]|nr:hypothetical protein [Alphaproteobacteria bacterium]